MAAAFAVTIPSSGIVPNSITIKTNNCKVSTQPQNYRNETQISRKRTRTTDRATAQPRNDYWGLGVAQTCVRAVRGGSWAKGRDQRGAGVRVVCHQSGGSVCGGGGDVFCGQGPWCRLPPWPLLNSVGQALGCCFLEGRRRKQWALRSIVSWAIRNGSHFQSVFFYQ